MRGRRETERERGTQSANMLVKKLPSFYTAVTSWVFKVHTRASQLFITVPTAGKTHPRERAYLRLGRVAEVGNGGSDVDLRGLGVVIVEGQVGHEMRVRQHAAQPTEHGARQRHAAVLCTIDRQGKGVAR